MKKIALFVGELPGGFQTRVAEGVIREAKTQGVQSVVFTNSGVYGGNVFYAYGEKNIINLPNLKDFDGIVIAGDTLGVEGMYEELAELIEREAECPVVCIRQKDERFYNVLVDNYRAMSDMVEHFITEHGFSRICFMTGKLEMYDAQRRLLGYLDTMKKHGLNVTPDMIYEGDYWRNKGGAAVDWFFKNKEEAPQAIVCSNDFMAISVCQALHERGIRIPKDVCVSGYDDTEEAKYSIPAITSMRVSGEELGKAAFHVIQNVNQGKEQEKNVYLGVEPCYRASCGCVSEQDAEASKALFIYKENLQRILYHSSSMRIAFENQDDFWGLMMVANAYIQDFGHDAIYICFCDEKEKQIDKLDMQQKYTEHMKLRAVFEKGNCRVCEERFPRRDILPEEYLKDGEPIYVLPFHENNNCLGYIVLKHRDLGRMKYILSMWIQGIADAIDRQQMYEENKTLSELRKNYNKDELTGIGNRREIERAMSQRQERLAATGEAFCIASVDMDGLKVINDKYGHLEGDEALCAFAEILAKETEGIGTAARTGGDEYMLCLGVTTDEEVEKIISSIRQSVAEYNKNSGKEYELDASIGYAFCRKGISLMACMQQADKNMYQEKRGKKNSRINN